MYVCVCVLVCACVGSKCIEILYASRQIAIKIKENFNYKPHSNSKTKNKPKNPKNYSLKK